VENGAAPRRLAAEGKRLPLLGNDDETANRQYIKQFVLAGGRECGRRHGIAYAESFHYVEPSSHEARLNEYIGRNAVPL